MDNVANFDLNIDAYNTVLEGGNVVSASSTNLKNSLPFKINDPYFEDSDFSYQINFKEN